MVSSSRTLVFGLRLILSDAKAGKTVLLESIVTVHVLPATESQPAQDLNSLPLSAVAVNTILVPDV